MARALDAEWEKWVDKARAVPIREIADSHPELTRLKLRGGVERSGACPCCGDDGRGRKANRFSINTRKGLWLCRQCKADGGDVIALIQFVERCDFIRACEILTGEAAPSGQGHSLSVEERAAIEADKAARRAAAEAKSEQFREKERRKLHRWWKRAERVTRDPIRDYLALRRCTLPKGACLRFKADTEFWADGKQEIELVHTGPAMLGAILGPEGRFVGLHLTWLDLTAEDGKLRLPDPETGEFVPAKKKMRGSVLGGRVELVRPDDPWHLVMGEGIETTLSVRDDLLDAGRDLAGVAFWSGLSLGNIGGPAAETVPHPTLRDRANRPRRVPGPVPEGEGIPIPDSVTRITLLRDGDSDPFLTDCALERASRRWARPGREIVAAEAPPDTDFNTLRRRALR